jgi:hypothetical protein
MAVWPVALPQDILIGASIQPKDAMLRSQMAIGEDKVRRRYTADLASVQATIYITTTQYTSNFLPFYQSNSASWFDWKDPISGNSKQLRFTGVPQFSAESARSPGLWRVELPLEMYL